MLFNIHIDVFPLKEVRFHIKPVHQSDKIQMNTYTYPEVKSEARPVDQEPKRGNLMLTQQWPEDCYNQEKILPYYSKNWYGCSYAAVDYDHPQTWKDYTETLVPPNDEHYLVRQKANFYGVEVDDWRFGVQEAANNSYSDTCNHDRPFQTRCSNQRQAANMRERRRMHSINHAFEGMKIWTKMKKY